MTISDSTCGPSQGRFAHTLDIEIDAPIEPPAPARSYALAWLDAALQCPMADTIELPARRAA